MEKFFEELREVSPAEDYLKEIKARKLPVIIFGAGWWANELTRLLNDEGIEILGYAVDEEYFRPDQTYLGRPVFNFEDSVAQYPDHIFICGLLKSTSKKRMYEFKHDKRITTQVQIIPKMESISRDYIFANRDRFEETYNLLEDDLSRKTMLAYLKTHVTAKPEDISNVLVEDEYFNELTRHTLGGGGGN